MERWQGRVALVTGANSGIGADIAKTLAREGMKVIGADKNINRVQDLEKEVPNCKGTITAIKCDLRKNEDIYALFDRIKKEFGGVDISVNNAGLAYGIPLLEGDPDNWREEMNINVIAVCFCSKLAIRSMMERNIDDGQIVNICSGSGHIVSSSSECHFYSATKFAVRAITEGLRQEVRDAGTNIRVSQVSPGLTKSHIFSTGLKNNELANNIYKMNKYMDSDDIAKAVLFMISAPAEVEIHDVIISPTGRKSGYNLIGDCK